MQSGLCHRVGRRRGRLHSLLGPHRADIYDGAAFPSSDHVLGHALRDEKDRPVDFEVAIIVSLGVLKKQFGKKDARRVHQHGGVAVLSLQTVYKRNPFSPVGYVRRFANHRAVGSEFLGRSDCLFHTTPNDDHLASEFKNQLGDCPAYSAASSDDDQFLSLKFVCHQVQPFDLLQSLWRWKSWEMLCSCAMSVSALLRANSRCNHARGPSISWLDQRFS